MNNIKPHTLTDSELADPEYMRAYFDEMNSVIAELLKDSERYRKLRAFCVANDVPIAVCDATTADELDRAIDLSDAVWPDVKAK